MPSPIFSNPLSVPLRYLLKNFTPFSFDVSLVASSIAKAIIWFIYVTVYGTAPLLLILIVKLIAPGAVKIEEISHLLNDLIILFLASALIAEVSIEAFLCKAKLGKFSYLFFFLSASLILGLVCIAYTIIITRSPGSVNFGNVWIFQTFVVAFTVIYCLSIKSILFFEEGKMSNEVRRFQELLKSQNDV